MSRLISLGAVALTALAGLGACSPPPSNTDLNPAGPPMIRQILVNEEYTGADGLIKPYDQPQLAFGHNNDPAFANDDGKVTTAIADPQGQVIRVVMDELLVGNALELVQCRGQVNNSPGVASSYSRVPLGTTPDDIANCSGPQDLVNSRCVGDHVVCINNTGTTVITDQGGAAVPPGAPVGIEDKDPEPDGDGVPDHDLFIEGSVRIMCKGVGGKFVEAPLDLANSYWQPSGNQQVPAMGGVGALGPALVLQTLYGLPTGTTCHVEFDPTVTDKDGNPVCAPPDGDVNQNCASPTDTSIAVWGVSPMRLDPDLTYPQNNSTVGSSAPLKLVFNTTMDVKSLMANVSITEDGKPFPITAVNAGTDIKGVGVPYTFITNGTNPGPSFNSGKTYVVTINANASDYAGQPLGTTTTRTFMTF
jgi:hypothetical protein